MHPVFTLESPKAANTVFPNRMGKKSGQTEPYVEYSKTSAQLVQSEEVVATPQVLRLKAEGYQQKQLGS